MKKFIPVQFLGSEYEMEKIVDATIDTLEREFKIRINQKVIVPAVVDSFLQAAFAEASEFGKNDVKKELNLFNLFRVTNCLNPETGEFVSIMSLGRMGMRKLDIEFDEEEFDKLGISIADIDIKLLEKISIRASQYLENEHNLAVRDYQVIFKVAEVFLDELLAYVKINEIDDVLTVFDQFTILLDDAGAFESIELTESAKEFIKIVYDNNVMALAKLEIEDEVGR